jgi:hypothetical protein
VLDPDELLFKVLAAIDFDSESGRRAVEVQDVRAEWVLSAKFDAIGNASSQVVPEPRFGVC